MQQLPPYWADCPLIGRPIEGTPFITAKTPIQPYNPNAPAAASASPVDAGSSSSALPQWSVPAEHTFTLSMLLRYHTQRGMRLGMIVDLTDGRFYEPQPLCRDNHITYINMYTPPPVTSTDSHAAVPIAAASSPSLPYGLTPHYLSALFRLLDTFTASHPSSYLLLHDIYSFDLSLFLLSLYLTQNSLSPSLAFQRACSSRPPGIANEAMVRYIWAEGGEEVEWDVGAVLKRPEWMSEEVSNWTWSGVGDRTEKRQLPAENKGSAEEVKAGEAEESKEPVKAAGTVRRKQPKKAANGAVINAAPSMPSSSSTPASQTTVASNSASIASSSDPYADMLADIGLASSAPSSSSASAAHTSSATSTPGSHKRKAPSSSASASSSSNSARPAAPSPTPLPTPTPPAHTNGAMPSPAPSTASLPVHKRHSYLVAVQMPHLQRLLSTLLHLVLAPSSHYAPTSFPQSSPTDIRAKLIMLASWLDRRPISRDALDGMVRERAQWSLTWSPVSDECLVLILKEGTFLLLMSAISAAPSASSASSASALPPLYHVPHLSFPTKSSPTTLVSNTVAVGSLLFDTDQRSPTAPATPRLLLIDLLSSPAHHPLPASLTRRVAALDTDVVLPRAQQRSVGEGKQSALHVRCKKYFPLGKLGSVLNMPLPHDTEGVEVWREAGDNRRGGRVWVWKKRESAITELELLAAMR